MRGARAANPYEYGAIFLRKFLACVPHAKPQNFAKPSIASAAKQSVSPRPTAYRTEYTDDTLSESSSGNARAPCHDRPNGRFPVAGSSWPVSFSSAPPSRFQEPCFQEPCFQELWLPARERGLVRSRRSAHPARARRRPAGIREPPPTRPP